MKAVVADLKLIYCAISIEQAEEALLLFSEKNGIKNIPPLAVHGIKLEQYCDLIRLSL